MNFLLIRPKISEKKDNIFSLGHLKEPPLGLLYIAAALENNGHKTEILDYFVENIPKEKLEKLLQLSNAVGITINTDFLKNAANLSSLI